MRNFEIEKNYEIGMTHIVIIHITIHLMISKWTWIIKIIYTLIVMKQQKLIYFKIQQKNSILKLAQKAKGRISNLVSQFEDNFKKLKLT